MKLDIKIILKRLSHTRPVFHSEADFQHAFAWEIHKVHPSAKVRLEYPIRSIEKNKYIDIWIVVEETIFAIEMKYKTAKIDIEFDDEIFFLKEQSALDLGRLGYLRDIERLESLPINIMGYSIFLTNKKGYWEQPNRRNTNDVAFRIHESQILEGELLWRNKSLGEDQYYEDNAIALKGTYSMIWENYSSLGDSDTQKFRYIYHEISKYD